MNFELIFSTDTLLYLVQRENDPVSILFIVKIIVKKIATILSIWSVETQLKGIA